MSNHRQAAAATASIAPLIVDGPLRKPISDGVTAVPAATIRPERVEWLWPDRIPRGTLTLLVGDPGLGKSLLTIDLAAQLSRGELGEAGAALLATGEDIASATVVPRLIAAGADLEQAHLVQRHLGGTESVLQLPRDASALRAQVQQTRAKLVVIDPLMAFLAGSVDSYKDQSIRGALVPLQLLAENTGAAVVAVAHLNKGQDADPLRRIAGSIGLQAAARSILLLGRDPTDPDGERGNRRLLVHVKSSLSELAPSLTYEVSGVELDDGVETARISCLGESPLGASELLASDLEPSSAMAEAMEHIRVELADGPKAAKAMFASADDAGISRETLRRAKRRLGVESKRLDYDGGWVWAWPEPAAGAEAT